MAFAYLCCTALSIAIHFNELGWPVTIKDVVQRFNKVKQIISVVNYANDDFYGLVRLVVP